MFALLGIIFPILILIDYSFLERKSNQETTREKYYKLRDNLNAIEYFIFTDSFHFLSDQVFFEHINKDDDIMIYRTKIFNTVTDVSFRKDFKVYKCRPTNIYHWPIFIVGITFICSLLTILKTHKWIKKQDFAKNDSVINLGIFNAIICLFTIFFTIFQVFD